MAVDYSGQFSALPSVAGTRLANDDQGSEFRAFDAVLFDFLKVPPEQYAFQLTILDLAAFKAIQPEELSSCGWTGQRRTELSPNVVAMIRRFNQTSFWVQREVLSAQKVRTRAEVVTHFIKVARRLYDLKNLHSLKAVVSALQATPIFRLQQTWQLVPRRDRDRLEELAKLVSEDDNYGNLRRFLEAVRLPCLPYLGLYLTDIVFIDVAHPHSGGLESHDRKLKMNNILRVIAEFQRSTYDHLQPSEHICEYLLSNRFIEELQKFVEDDYYKMSLRLEPPENENVNGGSGCSGSVGAVSSSSPPSSGGGAPLVEPTLASTAVVSTAADPVMNNSSQLNDSNISCQCVRRSSSSASCPLGNVTPSNALDQTHNECDYSSRLDTSKSKTQPNMKGQASRHKKNQYSLGCGKFVDDERLKGHSRQASTATNAAPRGTQVRASSSASSAKHRAPALFSACISSGETPVSSRSGDLDEMGIYGYGACDSNEISSRVSRSASESSTRNEESTSGNRSMQSSPAHASSGRGNAMSPQRDVEGSPSINSRTLCQDVGSASSRTVVYAEAANSMGLAAEEVVAEGPLLKKTLLRNGNRPAVSRWQPFWAVLYAPGSLLLYAPKRRLFARLSQPSAAVSSPGLALHSCSTASVGSVPASVAPASISNSTWAAPAGSESLSSSAVGKDLSSTSSSTYFYSGGLKKWLSCSSNFELGRAPAKVINLAGWMALPTTKPRKPDLFLLQEPSRGIIYKMRGGSQAAALEWSQRLREAIRKSSTVNLISFE